MSRTDAASVSPSGPIPAGAPHGALERRLASIPPPLVFVVSALSLYAGAALAVRSFDRVPPAGVAWWRQAGAATALLVVRRPWRRRRTREEIVAAVLLGLITATMNVLFYVAIRTIPLGTAVAIEFIGPIAVGAATARSRRGVLAVVIGGAGVATLAGVELGGAPGGLLAISAAAACWAGYILLGKRVALGAGIDGLAIGTAAATLITAGPLWHWSSKALDGGALLVATLLAVGLLSNAIPYGLDQVVLRRIGTSRFSVLLAILPTTATVTGAVLLAQTPTVTELVGISLVVIAVVANERTGLLSPAEGGPDEPPNRSARRHRPRD